jgi:hypothetical protein
MTDLRAQLVKKHGEDVVSCYEHYFPGELNKFDDRYCGNVGSLEEWAEECMNSMYDGFEEDVIPSLEAFIAMEFYEYYTYDEDLEIGFLNG